MSMLTMLLEITIYSAVITVATMLFKKLMKNSMSPPIHYVVWTILILRLCLPMTLVSPVHLFVVPQPADSVLPPAAGPAEPLAAAVNEQPSGQAATYEPPVTVEQHADSALQPITISQNSDVLTWQQVLVIVWLAGMGMCLAYLTVLYMSLKRKLRAALPPSPRLLALLEEVKTEMGIRSKIRLLCLCEYGTPAMLFPRTLLMPADAMVAMDAEQTKYALRHELTHWRRGDHIVMLVLSVLNAVYWFNPVVWLAFRQVRNDMETACDSVVVRRLDAEAKSRYATLIVRLFAQPAHRQLMLGMAHTDARKTAEQRVRGIFMRHKTKQSTMLAVVLLAAVLLVACFTTACQPTPEAPVVVGRQEDVLAAVEPVASDEFEPLEVPDHINKTQNDLPYVKISYDADVVVPETKTYPVTEVDKRVLTENDILSYIDLFAGSDYEMYFGWTLTKDDYLALLTKVEPYKGTERVTKQIVEQLQEMYEKATNDVVNQRISSLSEIPVEYAEYSLSVHIKTADGTISQVSSQRDGNTLWYIRNYMVEAHPASSLMDDQYTKNMDGPIENFHWRQPGKPDISQEDAYAVAQHFRDAMGIDLELYSAEPCSFITNYVDKTTGWQFTFTRMIAGIRMIDTIGSLGWRKETAPSYGSPWGVEKLVVSVDKNGLFSLYWTGASAIRRTVTESAQLMDFNTINQRITDQLGFNYAYPAEENGNYEIEISRIELGISMISMENRTDVGEYLPTWYVDYRYKPENEGEDAWVVQQIMFSAIDGSYIEPRITVNQLMGNFEQTGAETSGTGVQ